MQSQIVGTGSFVPDYRVTNEQLSEWVDTSDEWIVSRTGIRERRLTAEGTGAMASEAARRALENAKVTAGDVDLILAATCTPDYCFPSLACQVQAALGAERAVGMDIGAACSGFLFGLQTADAYIRSGAAKTVLVIGAETMSRVLDWEDRGTCVLFGDGAGAAVVKAGEAGGVLSSVLGSDGARGEALCCRAAGERSPLVPRREEPEGVEAAPKRLAMDGRRVFQFAVRTVPEAIQEALEKAGVSGEDISLYLLHQANVRILASIGRTLHVPEDKMPVNLDRYGNMAAASVPVLLDEMHRAGRLRRGDKLVLAGFGAGLTWGAMVLEW